MRPNILFLFPDQHRFDWLGLPGGVPIQTPNLARLAAHGVVFTRAVTPSPLCAPARACLASGRHYERCGVRNNDVDFPLTLPTFYAMLRDSGYHVMGCGKFDLAKALHDWGGDGKRRLPEWGFSDGVDSEGKWDGANTGRETPRGPYLAWLEQHGLRKTHLDDYDRRRRTGWHAAFPTPLPDPAYGDNWVTQIGLDLLDRAPRDKPWFLQVNFPGPHPPWDVTRSMEAAGRRYTRLPLPGNSEALPPDVHMRIRQNYSAMIENIDRRVGDFLARVEARGELGNTLVVYSSDHGEMLGDSGCRGKALPYQPSIGVPLICAGCGVRKSRSCSAPVTILDLAATFLDAAGLPVPGAMDSRSLLPLLQRGAAAPRRVVRSGLNDWRLAFDGRWKLIRRAGPEGRSPTGADCAGHKGDVLLFDLENDPFERENLAAKHPGAVRRLEKFL